MSTNQPLPMGNEPEENQQQQDPWEPARQAGFDPENTDWNTLSQNMQYLQALQDPDRHYDVLEQSLRAWGHLGPEQTLDDFLGPQGPPPPGQPPGQPQGYPQQGFPQQGYGGGYQEPEVVGWTQAGDPVFADEVYQGPQGPQMQPQGMNPQDIEERIIQRMREEVMPEYQGEMQSQLVARDLDGQMQKLAQEKNLSENDMGFLWDYVQRSLASRENIEPGEIPGFVERAYSELEGFAQARWGQMAQQQQQAPRTTPPQSGYEQGPPQQERRPREDWIKAAVRQTGERMGFDPNQMDY